MDKRNLVDVILVGLIIFCIGGFIYRQLNPVKDVTKGIQGLPNGNDISKENQVLPSDNDISKGTQVLPNDTDEPGPYAPTPVPDYSHVMTQEEYIMIYNIPRDEQPVPAPPTYIDGPSSDSPLCLISYNNGIIMIDADKGTLAEEGTQMDRLTDLLSEYATVVIYDSNVCTAIIDGPAEDSPTCTISDEGSHIIILTTASARCQIDRELVNLLRRYGKLRISGELSIAEK